MNTLCTVCSVRTSPTAVLCGGCGHFSVFDRPVKLVAGSPLNTVAMVLALLVGSVAAMWGTILLGAHDRESNRMKETASSEAASFLFKAERWSRRHQDTCPTFRDLKRDGDVSTWSFQSTDDPWRRPYRIVCTKDGVSSQPIMGVVSDGPDREPGTDDDISGDRGRFYD